MAWLVLGVRRGMIDAWRCVSRAKATRAKSKESKKIIRPRLLLGVSCAVYGAWCSVLNTYGVRNGVGGVDVLKWTTSRTREKHCCRVNRMSIL